MVLRAASPYANCIVPIVCRSIAIRRDPKQQGAPFAPAPQLHPGAQAVVTTQRSGWEPDCGPSKGAGGILTWPPPFQGGREPRSRARPASARADAMSPAALPARAAPVTWNPRPCGPHTNPRALPARVAVARRPGTVRLPESARRRPRGNALRSVAWGRRLGRRPGVWRGRAPDRPLHHPACAVRVARKAQPHRGSHREAAGCSGFCL